MERKGRWQKECEGRKGKRNGWRGNGRIGQLGKVASWA